MTAFSIQQGLLHAENVALRDIAQTHQTPTYVYSRAALTTAFERFQAGLTGHDHLICFAVKANPSLAILNLLPIPVLDGGHLLYYLIELVKGSPLSERSMVAGQYIGLALLAGLMGLAFYNDILRLVT